MGSEQAAWQAYEDDRKRLGALADKNIAPPTKSPVLVAHGDIGPQEYVLRVVRAIPAAQLQDALLVLPFSKVTQLMEHIDYWTSQEWDMALSARVLFFPSAHAPLADCRDKSSAYDACLVAWT